MTLEQALIRYDRLQSEKRNYNRYALGIYLQRAEEIQEAVSKGADMREEIVAGFSDRLRDFVLKALDLAPLKD